MQIEEYKDSIMIDENKMFLPSEKKKYNRDCTYIIFSLLLL